MERRISLRGFLFAGFVVVLGFAALPAVFPRGCNACKKALVEAASAFPSALHAHVEHALFAGDARAVYELARMPAAEAGQRAVVSARLCPACGRVAVAAARIEQWNGQEWKVDRQGGTAELLDDRALALGAALREHGPVA